MPKVRIKIKIIGFLNLNFKRQQGHRFLNIIARVRFLRYFGVSKNRFEVCRLSKSVVKSFNFAHKEINGSVCVL